VFEPVGRVETYSMLAELDCCIIAKVSTNVMLDNFTVYILNGKEISYVISSLGRIIHVCTEEIISFHLVRVGIH
jgi:hypothetical protein